MFKSAQHFNIKNILFPTIRFFQSSSLNAARFPALQTKISRHSHVKNMRKIEHLKKKLGKDYRIIGRDKRMSPYSERNSPSKPTQPPAPTHPPNLSSKFLISDKNPTPFDFIPGSLGKILKEEETLKENPTDSIADNYAPKEPESLTMPSTTAFAQLKEETDFNTKLKLPEVGVVPKRLNNEYGLELKTQSKPFYQHSLTPSESQFLFEQLPVACKNTYTTVKDNTEQQAEMLRRIISIDNANSKAKRKFNTARMIEMLQRHPLDTGSAPVQAAAMSVKIDAMKLHLSKNHKDKSTKRKLEYWISKQRKMLQYLRRKDLRACVATSEFIGVHI